MDSIIVDGLRARLYRAGPDDGPPVVYLHSGFGEVGALPLFDHLAGSGFRVLAPELPGFGHSDPPLDWHGIEDAVFHLGRLLDVLDLRHPTVVGSSLGGWLAAELAVWFPDRVGRLVLVDAVGLRVEGAPVADLFRLRPRELAARVLPNGGDLLSLLAPAIEGDDDPNAALLHLFHAMESTARLGWNPYLHDPKLARRLHLVVAPTLVLWGGDDGLVPLAHGEAYAAAIAGSTLEVLPDVGHLPALECPEMVAGAMATMA
jgi:pimeloyl-ACP methyl ester carboxylesterase